jgi:hypothetical protein
MAELIDAILVTVKCQKSAVAVEPHRSGGIHDDIRPKIGEWLLRFV